MMSETVGSEAVDRGRGKIVTTSERRARLARVARKVGHGFAVFLVISFVLSPIYVLLLVSLTQQSTEFSGTPQWLPSVTGANFGSILSNWRGFFESVTASTSADLIAPAIRNSLLVAVPVALVNMLVAAPAGYAFARLRFPFRRSIGLGLLATQMIPSLVLVLPIFILFGRVGLTNSLVGVGIADMSITLPFTIWIVSNSIQDTPVELERASRVDGLSRIGSITRVAIPLARSGVRTGGLFAFLFSWNDLIYPLILIVSPGLIMIQPALAGMYNLIASNFSQMAAAAVIAMVPTMVIAVFAMRPLVRGFLSGAVKG
jgi:multiple sugar transport system permease protein